MNLTLGTTQRPLSGGELKRLEVARAILAKRQVLLVDEGLSGLDAASATKLADLFLAFPGTLIEVEHHVSSDLINRYDRVIALAPKTEPKAANASDSVNASPVIQS
ncbi:ATP-binding cassette domain-containing protein [Lacticaseibacillus nasuensis]|uniref:ATP-binding cassette domain-containing protein n=1 Tax=Lacticaseibacillus nasuensis TaxID=944671 RepID=UPI0006D20475|nr:ATP-binding cassette domain-containing protein [Lacticaseibacillus nasuensis]